MYKSYAKGYLNSTMSIDGFLTFLGFLAAGYALLDSVSKLRISLHAKRQVFSFLGMVVSVSILILPKAPQNQLPDFYPQVLVNFISLMEASSIGVGGFAYILIFLWCAIAYVLYRFSKPTVGSLEKLNILVGRLLHQRRYLELTELLKPYMTLIGKAAHRKTIGQKLHDWLAFGGPFKQSIAGMLQDSIEGRRRFHIAGFDVRGLLRKSGRLVISPLAHLTPSYSRATQNAVELEAALLEHPGLLKFLVFSRADFIVEIMKFPVRSTEDFLAEIMRRMMHAPDSHFFRELKLLSTEWGGGGFPNEAQADLLRAIILDSKFAADHLVWKPVGDETIRTIKTDQDYRRMLLEKPYDDNADLLGDITYSTAKFFDIMVRSAMLQGQESHMWLMYMSALVRELTLVHSNEDIVDPEDEFPTLAMRLIWEIIGFLEDWILTHEKLPEENYHLLQDNFKEQGGASIISWSIEDYGSALREIAANEFLPDRFRIDRWESFVRLTNRLANTGLPHTIKMNLISRVVEPEGYSPHGDLTETLSTLHAQIDHVVRFDSTELNEALGF
ncbi:hypothetical protein [Maricaulis maris]|uniref:hypothetical protein n=1 Tax=Maricaulis maris TaxID=74318 RepID=UPI003A951970